MEHIDFWDFFVGFLYVLGGLGIFLFGMRVMSEGIQKVAGEGMRRIMATMTQNRFFGLMTGVTVTCLVQSSSATTVMVVSFVNAQLLTLTESIGIIMGANLGTHVDGLDHCDGGQIQSFKDRLAHNWSGPAYDFREQAEGKKLG